ncbi:hypothetical protein [Psychrobacter sp.]|uniref:hypothetical protein n=1 Tax=Psychrobacter sp. TaxID=56811 RepID=UPI002FDA9848
MLPPHTCLENLEAAGISQKDISLKVGANQSSVSRIQRQLFKSSGWQTVERIQSLHEHICIDKKSLDDFPDYVDFIKLKDADYA